MSRNKKVWFLGPHTQFLYHFSVIMVFEDCYDFSYANFLRYVKNLSKFRKFHNPTPIFLCWIFRTLGTWLSLTSRPDTNIDCKAWLIYRWPLVVPVNFYAVQPCTLGIFFWMNHRTFKAFLAINLDNGLWKFFRGSTLIWNCTLFMVIKSVYIYWQWDVLCLFLKYLYVYPSF